MEIKWIGVKGVGKKAYMLYYSKLFNGEVLNYTTYSKELYTLVKIVKNLKHYLTRNEKIIHKDLEPLQYL